MKQWEKYLTKWVAVATDSEVAPWHACSHDSCFLWHWAYCRGVVMEGGDSNYYDRGRQGGGGNCGWMLKSSRIVKIIC